MSQPASSPPATAHLGKCNPRPCADYRVPDEFAAPENRSSQMPTSLPAAANLPGPWPLPDAERWRKRFSLLDDRRNHRTIFEHELQLRLVITTGSDLLAAKRVPNRAMLRGMSTRRR